SNPTRSIKLSVRSPKCIESKSKRHNKKDTKNLSNYSGCDLKYNQYVSNLKANKMNRDIYNRKKLLERWKGRARNLLDSSDRIDIFKLIEHMEDSESSTLWIVRCITALLLLRKQLDKSFKDATKEDIKKLLKWMNEEKNYKVSTIVKHRKILKTFYKIVYGNNEMYPDAVNWFSVNVGKEKRRTEKRIDIEKYLEEDEIEKLVENAVNLQKKAFLGCMYESGARPEEFLTLSNKDILFDTNGAILVLRGKTGERRVRIIAYVNLLQQWLHIHPLKALTEFPLWISETTNYKNQQLGLRGAENIVKDTMKLAQISNKKSTLYVLRHSRATHLAKYFTEPQMCVMFGWRLGTKVAQNYIHLSGKDVDNTLISLNANGKVVHDEYKIKPLKCIKCKESISPGSNFCGKCSLPISLAEQYLNDIDLKQENRMLQNKLELFEEKMDNRINEIMRLIQHNPLLAEIKPTAILERINNIE
ncbi:MAG: tyrosine-type recombinase/integrase, partial [Nitrososphaeraceae archaeon]